MLSKVTCPKAILRLFEKKRKEREEITNSFLTSPTTYMWHSSPNVMSLSFLISLLFVLCCRNVEGAQSYGGWKLVEADIKSDTQLRDANKLDLDGWNVGGALKIGKNHIRVNDAGMMKLYGISVENTQLICDLGNEISRERRELELPVESDMGAYNEFKWYAVYRKYTEIVDKLLDISNGYPAVASYSNVGITYEERAIPLLKITGTTKAEKQKVLVIGGLQAREWLGPATVVYIAQRLASLYGYDEKITSLLDQSEVHFIPLANPDGYVYSWDNERLWKKNRRPNSNGSFGVDLGRNFNGTQWSARKVTSQSSNSYCGTQPFSEKETSAIRDHIRDNGPFAGAVEYGSYSQTVLRPHSYSSVPPESEPILKTIGDEWASIISRQKGVEYSSLSASSVSNVTGNARDFFFDYSHIPISFSVHLRDTGASYGYMVPVSNILPTCEENFPGFTYFLQSVYNYA